MDRGRASMALTPWRSRACFARGAALAILSLAAMRPAAAETMRLADALAVAYTANPQLEEARARLRATDESVAEALAGWRPSVNAGATYGYEHNSQGGLFGHTLDTRPEVDRVTVAQPVFSGGQAYAEVRRAKALVRAARATLVDTEQRVLLAAVTAYMDVVRDVLALHVHESDVEILQNELSATQTQKDAGDLTRTDVAQAQVRLSGAEADLATARAQLARSRDAFLRVIDRPAGTLDSNPALPRLPGSEDDALRLALASSPVIAQADANDRAAEYAVDDAEGALLPHISVVGQYEYNKNSLTSGLGTGIPSRDVTVFGQLNVPIYQGGGDEAKVREAKELKGQSRESVRDAQQEAEQALHDAWSALAGAQSALLFNQQRADASEQALANVKEEQKGGERSVIDVLNAEQDRLAAQIALVSSRHDVVTAAYQILAATGQLTARQLNLNVTLYDPKDHYEDDATSWFGLGD